MKVLTPVRASRSFTQQHSAPPERVFSLLCPVREKDWIDGWDPNLVITASGVAEEDCVFITPGDGSENAIWYIAWHDPIAFEVEMIKIIPTLTACRLSISVNETAGGSQSNITYMHTSLTPKGDEFVAGFTEEAFASFMRDWEGRINHYLDGGWRLG